MRIIFTFERIQRMDGDAQFNEFGFAVTISSVGNVVAIGCYKAAYVKVSLLINLKKYVYISLFAQSSPGCLA